MFETYGLGTRGLTGNDMYSKPIALIQARTVSVPFSDREAALRASK